MPSDITADCHCIIGHPQQARLLTVRQTQTWSLPTVRVPAMQYDYHAAAIARELYDRFRLNTRVLRLVYRQGRRIWLEMEHLPTRATPTASTAWMDRAELEHAFSGRPELAGPCLDWLDSRANPATPGELRPWQQPGWFEHAERWIERQLHRHKLVRRAPVVQYRAGWDRSCLLAVLTDAGWCYFKAASPRAPREAELVPALSALCPGVVDAPLAVEPDRNWMLSRDFLQDGELLREPDRLPECAAALARLQAAAMDDEDRWRALGCPRLGAAELVDYFAAPERLTGVLEQAGLALSGPERDALPLRCAHIVREAERLAEQRLTHSLVHTDFRNDNLVLKPSGPRIIDWSEAVVAEPHFALARILIDHENSCRQARPQAGVMRIPASLMERIRSAFDSALPSAVRPSDPQPVWEAVNALAQPWSIVLAARRLEAAAEQPSFESSQIPAQILARLRWMLARGAPDSAGAR
ncbi:hypothetical protein [Elongatibacter sediminis]|uniref:Aminoglycoside phosphotransferase domain-containing protein n=1 Tax=Elongatibacter sediminis TaxID=3119006 RepID=A0AAW9RAZ8_9GAMM